MIEAFILGVWITGSAWFVVSHFMGCTGGHHYEDEPDSVRLKVIPYHEKDVCSVTREETYECAHDGCHAEQSYSEIVGDVPLRTAENALRTTVRQTAGADDR